MRAGLQEVLKNSEKRRNGETEQRQKGKNSIVGIIETGGVFRRDLWKTLWKLCKTRRNREKSSPKNDRFQFHSTIRKHPFSEEIRCFVLRPVFFLMGWGMGEGCLFLPAKKKAPFPHGLIPLSPSAFPRGSLRGSIRSGRERRKVFGGLADRRGQSRIVCG